MSIQSFDQSATVWPQFEERPNANVGTSRMRVLSKKNDPENRGVVQPNPSVDGMVFLVLLSLICAQSAAN